LQAAPTSRGFDNAVQQVPSAPAPATHRGLDGPSQAKKHSSMVWSPGGGGGGGTDQPLYHSHADVGDISAHQYGHAPRSRPSPAGYQQISTDADYGGGGGHGRQDHGPPWRSRDAGGGGGGAWNQSQPRRGPPAVPASPERRQPPQQQQQQQRGRTQALRDYGSQGHPAKTSVSSALGTHFRK